MPQLSAVPELLKRTAVFEKQWFETLESKADAVLQRDLDAVLAWISVLLGKQRKTDYRPKEDDLSLLGRPSQTCHEVCLFLQNVVEQISRWFGGAREPVLLELGLAFHSLILEHLCKFVVSDAGGLCLAKYPTLDFSGILGCISECFGGARCGFWMSGLICCVSWQTYTL